MKQAISLRVIGDVPAVVVARLQAVTQLETLEDVLHWGGDVIEIVIQDEYTHDVILAAPAHLVFDTT
ncbi:MAG: hypothetical protein ABI867_02435 [Kofleriaceae bacterium]